MIKWSGLKVVKVMVNLLISLMSFFMWFSCFWISTVNSAIVEYWMFTYQQYLWLLNFSWGFRNKVNKLLQWDLNRWPLNSQTNTQPFSQSGQIKWLLSVCLRTKQLWVRVPLKSLHFQILHMLRAKSFLKFKQLQMIDSF